MLHDGDGAGRRVLAGGADVDGCVVGRGGGRRRRVFGFHVSGCFQHRLGGTSSSTAMSGSAVRPEATAPTARRVEP